MGCNCKRVNEITEEYGTKMKETIFQKIWRYTFRVLLYLMTMLFAIVLTPVVIVVVIYKSFFSKNKTLVLPNFKRKVGNG